MCTVFNLQGAGENRASFLAWARSSAGESARLISVRSVVRLYSGPLCGDVAQLGERRLCKPEVVGSIPIISTKEEVVSRLFSAG